MYLLDANILSDLVRHPRVSPVRERIARAGEEAVCTSIIVVAELRYGAAKSGAVRLAAQLRGSASPLASPSLVSAPESRGRRRRSRHR
jgi:tRNA(fMet)-specific endonuclease VapC